MEQSILISWLGFAVSVIAVGTAILGPRSRASAEAHRGLEVRVASLDTDIAEIRRDIEHLPDVDATHRQELMIAEIKGKMDVLTERLKPVQDISSRLQEFLLEQAKAK